MEIPYISDYLETKRDSYKKLAITFDLIIIIRIKINNFIFYAQIVYKSMAQS